jgi:hypothetical protein
MWFAKHCCGKIWVSRASVIKAAFAHEQQFLLLLLLLLLIFSSSKHPQKIMGATGCMVYADPGDSHYWEIIQVGAL